MNRINAASIRKVRSLFTTFQKELNAALEEMEHANNVYSCTLPQMHEIINQVARFYRVDSQDILSRKRDKDTAWARQVCMFIATKKTSHGLQRIGEVFFRDKSTVLWAERSVTDRMQVDKKAKSDIEELLK